MTKWKRLRKLREKKRFEAEVLRPKAEVEEVKQTKPEKISKNIQQSQEIEKLDNTKNSKPTTILAQIPRYVYLLAIFALLTGVFFPLITPGISFDYVIQGVAILFLGRLFWKIKKLLRKEKRLVRRQYALQHTLFSYRLHYF